MKNYSNDNTARRYLAHVGLFGTSQLHLRNPYIVAWWSAAFPGFGHLLLSKNLRGFVLIIWEVVVNIHSCLNIAMVYTFQGKFELAKDVLDTRVLLIYIPVYIFGIWDSYRTTVDINDVYLLASSENHSFNSFSISPLEINYLDKRKPIYGLLWSLIVPGLGQLYLNRILIAFFVIIWTVVFCYFSHGLESIILLIRGNIEESTRALKPEWFMFFPSIYGFAAFDAYMNTIEQNKLFEKEQRNYLLHHYQSPSFIIRNGLKERK
ncbi:membrane protein [Bacillus coahuilensis p1.1.43]|uniref:Membrane protein n=1 Tax=Bacillus coahuilensis p1.1.43 TaxID=1150625 RepID=A0A147KAM5_9BACI|nr:hypothetical protein [Bacillus coahuilensis]KUP07850.1 membrane protein [Bacillus coahuilensis p1.1.43]